MLHTEVRRVDELLTESELRSFLKVAASLPDQKIPPLANIWLAPPTWNSNRPIRYLVQQENKLLEEQISPNSLLPQLPKSRKFERALKEAQLTPEQFSGLLISFAVTLLRDEHTSAQELDRILDRGRLTLQRLTEDERVFSSLSDDGAHYLLQQASWITLCDRATRLQQVPDLNLELVRRHREELLAVLPESLLSDPLEPLRPLLNESGLPFEELPESGSDAQLSWVPPPPTVPPVVPDMVTKRPK